jgi:hypothetical protein
MLQSCQPLLSPPKAACSHPAHDVQDAVDEQLTRTFPGSPDYRLALFRGDGPEQTRDGPGVGWGYIAYKLRQGGRVHHIPFRISHLGYYVTFSQGQKAGVVRI